MEKTIHTDSVSPVKAATVQDGDGKTLSEYLDYIAKNGYSKFLESISDKDADRFDSLYVHAYCNVTGISQDSLESRDYFVMSYLRMIGVSPPSFLTRKADEGLEGEEAKKLFRILDMDSVLVCAMESGENWKSALITMGITKTEG